jgi:hypothetical protein
MFEPFPFPDVPIKNTLLLIRESRSSEESPLLNIYAQSHVAFGDGGHIYRRHSPVNVRIPPQTSPDITKEVPVAYTTCWQVVLILDRRCKPPHKVRR